MPVERLGADRRIMRLHDGVVAERRDDARPMCRVKPRQRLDVEVVVMTVRHQHDVDRRQRFERNAGIVDPHRSHEADRRDALRPDRVDQDVEARGLQKPARVAHVREPPLGAIHACGRRIAIRARRPVRARAPSRGSCTSGTAWSRSSAAMSTDRRTACRRNGRRRARRSSAPRRCGCRTRQPPPRWRRIRQTGGGGRRGASGDLAFNQARRTRRHAFGARCGHSSLSRVASGSPSRCASSR